jgi:predicted AlkP superfamily pyrophosphatase or phosphodiesterase
MAGIKSRLAVLDVVGLTRRHLESGSMPRLRARADRLGLATFPPTFPALTCSAQSSFLTGQSPAGHGIVGNGWYHRELCEVQFWKQPDALVQGRKIWHRLRDARPGATTAKTFWWYNMYSEVEHALTPRPMYPADGRKIFDIYTTPPETRFEIQRADQLGPFPFRHFWGPAAGIESSRWIADSARWIEEKHRPTLQLVYLPHLDYPLQRSGPDDPGTAGELAAVDDLVADLADWFEARDVGVVILSEYGITPVSRPVSLNRALRRAGWLTVKDELGLELLDPGASKAFAVADHQIAHVYVQNGLPLSEVKALLAREPGVAKVCEPSEFGWTPDTVAGQRAGDLIVLAEPAAWFTYYYWLDDQRAPDFARTIDIHRKPGYDPCELHIDPALRFPKLKILSFLAKKKLGLRGLLEVVPLDPTLVKGSHGLVTEEPLDQPVYLGPGAADVSSDTDAAEALAGLLGCWTG